MLTATQYFADHANLLRFTKKNIKRYTQHYFEPTCRWIKTTDPRSLHVPPCRSTCSMRRIWRKRMPLRHTRHQPHHLSASFILTEPFYLCIYFSCKKQEAKAHRGNSCYTWWQMWQTLGRWTRRRAQWLRRWPQSNLGDAEKNATQHTQIMTKK